MIVLIATQFFLRDLLLGLGVDIKEIIKLVHGIEKLRHEKI